MTLDLPPLPIDALLPELLAALRSRSAAVVKAPTGAGKTTRVPPALLEAGIAGAGDAGGRVLVTEPRRLAARAAARRMAHERRSEGWELGGVVGYQVRFDHRATADTRLVVMTEGVLLQRLQGDPFLEGVSVLVFDEIHERSLQLDLALAMARRVQREVRPDLKLVAMSATLDPGPVAAFLGEPRPGEPRPGDAGAAAPVIESEGRLHPVEVQYSGAGDSRRRGTQTHPRSRRAIAARAAAGAREMLAETSGDVLVFLPGVGEIRATEDELGDLTSRGVDVLPLFGNLPPERQDAVLSPSDRRKVVLATNVAETSVTVPGVTAVVDTGLARQLRFDPSSGLDRLDLGRISRASADQRAGRAGRERPGIALRLWSEAEHRGLPERETPEIRRVDLAAPVLQLMAWGESDPADFGWFEAPSAEALDTARELLNRLGATDPHGVTAEGRRLARLPVHPRLARLLSEGHRRGVTEDAALAAAILSERDPVRAERGPEATAPTPSFSDLLDRVEAVAAFGRSGRIPRHPPGRFLKGAARFVLDARKQLVGLADRELEDSEEKPVRDREARTEALTRALLAAFPDRLCRRRGPRDRRALMVGGGGVVLARESAVTEPELFLALDLDAGTPGIHAEALVRHASGVERPWLPEERLTTTTETELDPERGRAIAFRRTRWHDLVIEEREVPAPPEEAARVLAEAAAEDLERALPLDDPAVASFLDRLRSLARWRPELELPTFTDRELEKLLPALAAGRRSFAELRNAPLLEVLEGSLSFEQRQALEREAPERLRVPSGSRMRLDYTPGKPPVLAVRIQELFGLTETPKVAGGRVPVRLHLLAPNYRPQQVTQDLASFWENVYPQVRKELAGRYPKHAWPEDPLTAKPTRRTRGKTRRR